MKNFNIKFLLIICFSFFLQGCEEETYIQDIGYSLADSDDGAGYYVIYSTTAINACGSLTVSIDGKVVGDIKEDYDEKKHGVVGCSVPPYKNAIVRALVKDGGHTISVKAGNGCTFNDFSHSIKAGQCFTLHYKDKNSNY